MCCNGNEALGKKTCPFDISKNTHSHHGDDRWTKFIFNKHRRFFVCSALIGKEPSRTKQKSKTKTTNQGKTRSGKYFVMAEKRPYDNVEFDWIQLSADLDPSNAESFLDKWKRKFGENPFVPIGKCDVIKWTREKLQYSHDDMACAVDQSIQLHKRSIWF